MEFTAVVEVRVEGVVTDNTKVVFKRRQSAIEYLWPFYKSRNTHRTYTCKIVRSDGVVLLAPGFGNSHYGS